MTSALEPTSYHHRLRATLAEREPGLVRWLSSDAYEAEHADAMRLELLRSSYRLAPESHERPHRLARAAADALGVTVPVSIYQLHDNGTANAMLFFTPDAAHVALAGPLLANLADDELSALFGHELAHHLLWTIEDGAFRVCSTLVEQSAASGSTPFVEAALRQRLWTEVVCDRGAALASSTDAAIRCLVKVATGLGSVSATDYLAQAREIVAKTKGGPRGRATHPETAVRALALALWDERRASAEPEIGEMIDGPLVLESLDLVQREEVAGHTRAWIDRLLGPPWMRTEAALAHARAFFPEGAWPAPGQPERRAAEPVPAGLEEYCAYVPVSYTHLTLPTN